MVNRLMVIGLVVLVSLFSLGAKKEVDNKTKEPRPPVSKNAPGESETKELKKICDAGDLIIENIFQSMNKNDHQGYIRDFNESMQENYKKDIFKKNTKILKSKIGNYVSKQFWKLEKMQQHFIVYYKAKFTKEPAPVIVRLVLEQTQNKLAVAFLSFQSPKLAEPDKPKKRWWFLSWF